MSSVFEPLGPAQKHAFHRAYLAHLRRHDGDIDRERRRFGRREAIFRAIVEHPIVLDSGPLVSQSAFARDEAVDRPTAWALATAKANLSERHAMDIQLARSASEPVDADDPQSYIDIEEFYHTRILADALDAVGLKVSFGPPPLSTRILIAIMIRLPRAIANLVILAAELGGVVLFRMLLEEARRLFAHEPSALERVDRLFGQILADEIGHVLFVRSRLGRARLWLAERLAVPIVAALYRYDVPEIDRLFGERALLDGMRRTDVRELWRIHPDPLAAAPLFAALGVESTPAPSSVVVCRR
jgi:hypothetical protein